MTRRQLTIEPLLPYDLRVWGGAIALTVVGCDVDLEKREDGMYTLVLTYDEGASKQIYEYKQKMRDRIGGLQFSDGGDGVVP